MLFDQTNNLCFFRVLIDWRCDLVEGDDPARVVKDVIPFEDDEACTGTSVSMRKSYLYGILY